MVSEKRKYAGYNAFEVFGIDEDTAEFYSKGTLIAHKEKIKVLGELSQTLSTRPSLDPIVMHCCLELWDNPLKLITCKFGLKHVGSASASIHHIKKYLIKSELKRSSHW